MNEEGEGTPKDGRTRKSEQWSSLEETLGGLLRGGRAALRKLTPDALSRLVDDYQRLSADLARARSLGAPRSVVERLNRIAVAGHIVLYSGSAPRVERARPDILGAFPRAVRSGLWALLLSGGLFAGAVLVTYAAVSLDPSLGYDLVPDEFRRFDPAHEENLHEIPGLARPFASSAIIANNINVALMAFGFGLTAGIGTAWVMVYNGVHIGAVAAWFALEGKSRAFWGWVMPHGGTELMAICLAGAAGFLLAGAIVSPGRFSRTEALKRAGLAALVIEVGCMAMLVVAGLIEGLVSPSAIGYPARVLILGTSVALWALYLAVGGRAGDPGRPAPGEGTETGASADGTGGG